MERQEDATVIQASPRHRRYRLGARGPTSPFLPFYKEINDSLYELYSPKKGEVPTVEIILFHGLHEGDREDAFWRTWTNGNECWPQTWLTEETNFPRARILSVSYDSSVVKSATEGRLELYNIGENLVGNVICSGREAVRRAAVGQQGNCPIILVAHSLGGLVIKQMILHAEKLVHQADPDPRVRDFLESVAGIFYFSTPHVGADIRNFTSYFAQKSSVTSALSVLSDDGARLNHDFRLWRSQHKIKAYAVVESEETVVGGYCGLVVSEASARVDVDYFYYSKGNHFTVCAPESPEFSSALDLLTSLIKTAVRELPGHFPSFAPERVHLPFSSDSKYVLLQTTFSHIKSVLETEQQQSVVVTLYGGPGVGKSSLAKHVALYYQQEETHIFDKVFYLNCGREAKSTAKHLELLHILTGKEPQAIGGSSSLHGDQELLKHLSNESVLIILDNVEEPELFQSLFVWIQSFAYLSIKYLVTSQNQRISEGSIPIRMGRPCWDEAWKILSNHADSGWPQFEEFPQHLQEEVAAIIRKWDSNPSILADLGMLMKETEDILDPEAWEMANEDLMDLIDQDDRQDSPRLFDTIYHRTSPSNSVLRDVDALAREQQRLLYLVAMCAGPPVPELVLQIFLNKIGGPPNILQYWRRRRRVPSLIQMENTTAPWNHGVQKTWFTWSMDSLPKYIIKTKRKSEVKESFNSLATAFCSTDSFLSNVDVVDTELLATLCVEYGDEELSLKAIHAMGFPDGPASQVKSLLRPFIWTVLSKIEGRTQQHSRLFASEVFLQYIGQDNPEEASHDTMDIGTGSLLSFLPGALAGCMEAIEIKENIVLQKKAARCLIDLAARPANDEKWLEILENSVNNAVKVGSSASVLEGIGKLMERDDSPILQEKAVDCLRLIAYLNNNTESKIGSVPSIVEALVKLLARDGRPILQELAAGCLGSLANDHENQVIACIPNAIECLVNLVRKDWSWTLQLHASGCLGSLALNDDNKVKIACIPGAVESLVNLLGKDCSPLLEFHARWCLVSLANNISALEQIGKLLGRDDSPILQEKAAFCLRHIAFVNNNTESKIASVPSIVEALVRLLAKDSLPILQEHAAGCLGSLANDHDNQVMIAGIPNAIECLVNLVRKYWSWTLQLHASGCLGSLALNDDNKVKIACIPGAVESLVNLLGKDCSPLLEFHARWCLVSLANNISALEQIGKLLGRDDSPILQEKAAFCLRHIAFVNNNTESKIASVPSIVEALVRLLAKDSLPILQEHAAGCLGSLAIDHDNQVMIAGIPNAIKYLVDLVAKDQSLILQEHASGCLGSLAINDDNKVKIACIPGAVESLVDLLAKKGSLLLLEHVSGCLGSLALNDDYKVKIAHNPDAIEAFLDLLAKGGSERLQKHVTWCLEVLAMNDEGMFDD